MKGLIVRLLDSADEISPLRRLVVSALVIALLCAICLPFFVAQYSPSNLRVEDGAISFARAGPLTKPVTLEGEWDFTWHDKLGDVPAGEMPRFAMAVPGVWNMTRAPNGVMLPRDGVATFGVTIKGLAPARYRISIPTIFVASEVTLNGKLVSGRGRVGRSAADTRYQWRAQDIGFDADGRDVRLEIKMAAHLHRDNGFDAAPVIGLSNAVGDWTSHRLAQEFLTQISLMTIGFFCLVVFLYRARDPSFLYFSIAAFALMPASLMLGFDNLFTMAFPDVPFAVMLAIVYLGSCVSIAMALVYVHSIYRAESPIWGFRGALSVVLGFSIVQAGAFIAGGTYLASLVNVRLVLVMLIVFAYMLWVISRAVWRQRDGAFPFLIGLGVFTVVMLMVGSIASGIFPRDRFGVIANAAFGILILLFSHIVVLAERWARSISSSEAVTDDLRQLLEVSSSITSEMELEALLARIVEVASRILRAERSTLYLHDAKHDELWALFAEGMEHRVIRFQASKGIAGHVFGSGEALIVDDVYADPHFNAEVDERTGFRTKTMIAVPIMTREGRKLGVLQALNRRNGERFGQTDLARLRAFAAQAAIALDNATLFTEVAASRNYNESILRSMSSGVVTLDPDAKVAKFNAAACAILRVSPETLEGVDARAWLAETNPPLIAELDAVSANSDPKTMLDFDLVTGDGSHRSVNITIVPLVSEAEEIGLLILLEDISEGKRLRGAMRRFMPQEVVEQVLDRDDDKMFGTACHASVLFADIRDFTGMAEALTPRETVDMLNEIFTDLFEAVSDAGGVLDKYIGDAIMAVFGAPLSTGRDALNAVEAAVRMQEMMAAINLRRAERGAGPLRIGIGIATGEVIAGTVGSPKRMDYTVIGDSVNLAARLEDATKIYRSGILICQATAEAIGDAFALSEIDRIQVKGRQRLETIFEVKGRT